jgi:GDPmannose 4,6-dehydratase
MRALITGITGQDGAYLAQHLLSMGYEVFGLKRRVSTNNTARIEHLAIADQITILDGDLMDTSSLIRAVKVSVPDEIYNLAAQSFVMTSFDQPELTGETTGLGVTRLLEAVRLNAPKAKFYQASTSEMFGGHPPPQSDDTPFYPRSPYGAAKLYAHWMTVNYREAYNMFACCGILFNHESIFRGSEFVTQKIAQGVAAIKLGFADHIELGNLEAKRDWGHARDFVKAMHLMLQQQKPEDFVIATGEAHTVREFCELAFDRVGLKWEAYVRTNEKHLRPSEVSYLLGDCSKAKRILGWRPETSFESLVNEMVDHALSHSEEWRKA